jgi:cytoskeleton protein RodZ
MNLGEVLYAARTAAGISLEDLADATSIRPGLLSEMERNDFAHCGGDIYAKGHLRNIAPKLGLDINQLLDQYNEEHSAASRSINEMLVENNVARVPHEKKRMSWKVPAAFSLSIVLVLAVVQIVISNVNSESTIKPTATPSATAAPAPSESATASASPLPSSGGVTLVINAVRGSSLADIVINGEHVFHGNIFQNDSKTFASDTSISVYFSNPAGLDLTVNGELIAPLGGQNQEVRRTFR